MWEWAVKRPLRRTILRGVGSVMTDLFLKEFRLEKLIIIETVFERFIYLPLVVVIASGNRADDRATMGT
jgi:hypothetical protein